MMLFAVESTSLGSNGLLGSIALVVGGVMVWALNRRSAALEAELMTERQLVTSLQSQTQTLTAAKTTAQAQSQTLQTELEQLQVQLSQLEESRSTLTAQAQALQEQVETLQGEQTHDRQELQDLNHQLTTLNRAKASLEAEVSTLNSQVTALTQEKETLRQDNATVTTEVATLQGEVEQLTTQVNTLTGERDTLRTEVVTLTSAKTALESEVEGLREQLADRHRQMTDLQDKLDAQAEQMHEWQEIADFSQVQAAAYAQEHHSTNSDLQDLRVTCQVLKGKLSYLRQAYNTREVEFDIALTTAQEEVAQLQQQLQQQREMRGKVSPDRVAAELSQVPPTMDSGEPELATPLAPEPAIAQDVATDSSPGQSGSEQSGSEQSSVEESSSEDAKPEESGTGSVTEPGFAPTPKAKNPTPPTKARKGSKRKKGGKGFQ